MSAIAELGTYLAGFAQFRKMLSAVPQDARLTIFTNAASEAATYVSKGLDRVVAADELNDIAVAYGLDDIETVQWIISQAFEKIEEPARVPDDIEVPAENGHDKHAPSIKQPLFPYEPQPFENIAPRKWLHAKHYVRRHVVMTVAPGGYG